MQVFISYSTGDLGLAKHLADHLRPYATVRYWDQDNTPGDSVWNQIYEWIDDSDLLLAVITDKTVSRAMAVGNEIGRAKDQGTKVIALVTDNVQASDLACLQNSTYIRIDRSNPGPAMEKVTSIVKQMDFEDFVSVVGCIVLAIGAVYLLARKQ